MIINLLINYKQLYNTTSNLNYYWNELFFTCIQTIKNLKLFKHNQLKPTKKSFK